MDGGSLTLVATPIVNLGDLSPRAESALREASLWIVEDTRVSGKLQAHLGIQKPMRVLNEHTSEAKVHEYLVAIEEGAHAVLLTDGGAPGISDPGAFLADQCHERGIAVDAVSGPSAVVNALMLSGFYAQRFTFFGFLPRKEGAIRSELAPFSESSMTLVMFEAPYRIEKLLRACAEALPERRYAICREMTKMHEQCWRGRFPEIPTEAEVPRKGEFTVVIEGMRKRG
jgi:16S rRNA (cytidine1402-2'-O)-methyltransferase